MTPIKKIVIPVAGYGTRFLPFTKSIPKEMLPIVDRPIIQYIIESAVAAGIEEVILVTGMSKRAIEDYFDYNLELDYMLEQKGKTEQLKLSRSVSDIAKFVYVRQKEQKGTGHAILQVKELINDEPFMVCSGDDLYMGDYSNMHLLKDVYEKYQSPVMLSMERSAPSDYDNYGYLKLGEKLDDKTSIITEVIEKPGYANAPSTQATFMNYVLTPDIFPLLETQEPGKNGEIQVTEAINRLAQQRQVVSAAADNLNYFDCGNKLEYMKATIQFALERDDIGNDFREYLKGLAL
jgi:UTP--glucose-1-phosphate uridylyltransferase